LVAIKNTSAPKLALNVDFHFEWKDELAFVSNKY